jgi:hypothetical protein
MRQSDPYEQHLQDTWETLINNRFAVHFDGMSYGDARDSFTERIFEAVDTGGADLFGLPLLFEENLDRRDVIENEVLADLNDRERRYLKAHPDALGIRCEAYLLSIPVEQLLESLTPWQRQRLGEITSEALLDALPSLRYEIAA